MKLFVSVFMILMVLEEFNCGLVLDYYGAYPVGRSWRTDCGFGYPHNHYPPYFRRPYYYYDWSRVPYYDDSEYDTQDSKEIDALGNFQDKGLIKPTEKSSEKPLDKLSEQSSAKPLDKSLEEPSDQSSNKLLDLLIIPPKPDIPNESTADIDLPNEQLDEHL